MDETASGRMGQLSHTVSSERETSSCLYGRTRYAARKRNDVISPVRVNFISSKFMHVFFIIRFVKVMGVNFISSKFMHAFFKIFFYRWIFEISISVFK
jgi:hypothetical protein